MSANNQSDFTYAALQIDEAREQGQPCAVKSQGRLACFGEIEMGSHQTIDQAVGAASHRPNCDFEIHWAHHH